MRVMPEICKGYQTYTSSTCIDLSASECRQCIDLKDVCNQCKDADFTSCIPPIRPWKRCIESNLQCLNKWKWF